jgi:hypothetical protein
MALPRTFVGFSSSDVGSYQLMRGWKAQVHIDFDFCDCGLEREIKANDETHIKECCRARIKMAGAYIMLIGPDTLSKNRYVQWEAQVAREKGCKMIGVNLNHKRHIDVALTPAVLHSAGVLFVPFSPQAVKAALEVDVRRDRQNYQLMDEWYESHGYELAGETARLMSGAQPVAAE